MGRKSQAKGRRGEAELSHVLQGYGYDVRPGEPLNYGKEPDIVGLPGVHIECKRCQQLRIGEWMQQAAEDAKKFDDGFPVVFFRRNHEPWRVVMALPDWLQLYRSYQPPSLHPGHLQPPPK